MSDFAPSHEPDDAPPLDDGIPRGRFRRASSLAGVTARAAGEAVAAGWRGSADPELHARTAERYAELLGHSKGALMKAGQLLSFLAATPMASAESQSIYQTALARLSSDAPPMAPALARAVLERELGRPAEQVFAELDQRPLAAASIGQVHAGRLRDGRAVAVKIQYPGAADAICSDLKNFELLATFLSLAFGLLSRLSFDVRSAAREMSLRITEELDYRLEMANQAEFADCYRGHPFIHVPDVVEELCTARVLTQELASGRDWGEALQSPQELRNLWGEAIYRFAYGSFADFGLIHADPHPGNYLFHDDGSVSFLDYGCVKRFSRAQVEACRATFRAAYVDEDPLATWEAGVEAELWRASDPITPAEVFVLWRGLRGYLFEEQPLTITAAHVDRCATHCSPDGPSANVVRNISGSTEYAVMPRVEWGVLSLLAQLSARSDWRAVGGDCLRLGEEDLPLTALGGRHKAFCDERRAASGAR